MKLIFVQSRSDTLGMLSISGISRCYIKHISPDKDQKLIKAKWHHHTGFEIHIIESGSHTYEIGDKKIKLEKGEFLLIPPRSDHRITETAVNTNKYSITFSVDSDNNICSGIKKAVYGKLPDTVWSNLELIIQESQKKQGFYNKIIENRILECIFLFLRFAGINDSHDLSHEQAEDHRFSLAVQYISDNICSPVTVKELAVYCALSSRQLSRVFEKESGISTSEYIMRERFKRIEELLADPKNSLKQISELMNFENEYYFNTFFKKHSGMSPGVYRKNIKMT